MEEKHENRISPRFVVNEITLEQRRTLLVSFVDNDRCSKLYGDCKSDFGIFLKVGCLVGGKERFSLRLLGYLRDHYFCHYFFLF